MIVTCASNSAKQSRLFPKDGQHENYRADFLGQNSRLDEIHAAILQVKLRKLEQWNGLRRAVAARYRAAFRELPVGLQAETGLSNYHLFVITTPLRDKLRAHLAESNIPTLVHYPIPLYRQKAFAEFSPARCPNADLLCS